MHGGMDAFSNRLWCLKMDVCIAFLFLKRKLQVQKYIYIYIYMLCVHFLAHCYYYNYFVVVVVVVLVVLHCWLKVQVWSNCSVRFSCWNVECFLPWTLCDCILRTANVVCCNILFFDLYILKSDDIWIKKLSCIEICSEYCVVWNSL